jgi:hypothetical protein
MKRIKILLIIIALPIVGNCQQYYPFPVDSAQWSIEVSNSQFDYYHYQLKNKGDTVLGNGMHYSKVYKSNDLEYDSAEDVLHCFLREDSTKKIHVKYPLGNAPDTNEFILFDYSLEIGDTFQIRLFDGDSIITFNQILNDTIINEFYPDRPRVEYYMRPLDDEIIWTTSLDNNYVWIEGIGTNYGLLYNELPPNYGEVENTFLVCFNLYGDYIMSIPNCGSVGIEQTISQNELKILPNPVSYTSKIIFSDIVNEIQQLNIVNYSGQNVKSLIKPQEYEMYINSKEFLPGLYILNIVTINNEIYHLKFIINQN